MRKTNKDDKKNEYLENILCMRQGEEELNCGKCHMMLQTCIFL